MWLNLIIKYKKPLFWLVLILAIVITVYFWKKKSDSQKAIGDLKVDKANLTITNNQAILISENLLGAMDKMGTDDKVIIDNLKTLREADLLLVMKTFGVKPYNGMGLTTNKWEKLAPWSSDLNLTGWLHEELSGDSLDQVAAIFANNNIPF